MHVCDHENTCYRLQFSVILEHCKYVINLLPLQPMTESELADELDFTCSPSPVVQKTPPAKPKVSIRMNLLF